MFKELVDEYRTYLSDKETAIKGDTDEDQIEKIFIHFMHTDSRLFFALLSISEANKRPAAYAWRSCRFS